MGRVVEVPEYIAQHRLTSQDITIYGAQWCADCKRSKEYLNSIGASYTYIDIQDTPDAAAAMQHINGGRNRIPTIQLANGVVLVEPSDKELQMAIQAAGIGPAA